MVQRWIQLGFDKKTIEIRRKSKRHGLDANKRETVTIPLSEAVIEPLKRLRALSPKKELVFNKIGNLENRPEVDR